MASQRAAVLTRSASTADRRISRDDMFLGPQVRHGMSSSMDRRISRDDLYLSTRPNQERSNYSTRCPVQMQRIATLEELSPHLHKPKSTPLAPIASPPSSACMPLAGGGVVFVPDPAAEIPIGMALGSPMHPPASLQTSLQTVLQTAQQLHGRSQSTATEKLWPARKTSLPSPESTPLGATNVSGAYVSSVTSAAVPVVSTSAVSAASVSAPVASASVSSVSTAPPPATSTAPTSATPAATMTPALAPAPATAAPVRTKTTRRKLFGLFGGKRHQEPQPAAEHREAASSLKSPEQAAASGPQTPPNRVIKKHQPIVIPNIEPAVTSPPGSTPRDKNGRPQPYLRPKASEPIMNPKKGLTPLAGGPLLNVEIPDVRLERYSVMFGNLLHPAPGPATSTCPASSASPMSTWQPASSLLARRQANLDRLKMIHESWSPEDQEQDKQLLMEAAAAGVDALLYPPLSTLQRRATSPGKSPSFSLFPGRHVTRTPKDADVISPSSMGVAISSPRMRSNTLPPGMDSPVQMHFPDPRTNPLRSNPYGTPYQASRRAAPIASPPSSVGTAVTTTVPMPVPTTITTLPTPRPSYDDENRTSVITESPTSIVFVASEDGEGMLQPQAYKRTSTDPQWQMVSPPSTASLSSVRSAGSSSGSSTTGNELAGMESLVPDGSSFPPAVEISIARQISVSRQQRKMLRPLQAAMAASKHQHKHEAGAGVGAPVAPVAPVASTSASENTDGNAANAGNCSPSGSTHSATSSTPSRSGTIIRLNRNERLQETRSATPTLVLADTTMATGGSQHQQPEAWAKSHHHQSSLQQGQQSLTPPRNTQNRKSEQAIIEGA